ncbi:MAG: FG-GAP-like repeat-containing protein [Cyclobacteriaceae bacterium]|nr:FG-GAP-like repeat-containing protein [Cyclobacteriaceae bacterium]
MRKILLFILTGLTLTTGLSQVPYIQQISPMDGSTQSRVIITGSGFSATSSNLAVTFDNVRAVINASTEFTIDVTLPVQARAGNVEVTNLVSGLSAKSPQKFVPYYSGSTFDPSKVSAPLAVASTKELFDICSCDFDMDGKTDFGITKFSTVDDPAATDLVIMQNQSTPGTMNFTTFNKATLSNLNVNAPTFNLNCGDLDGDGKPDLVATRAGASRNALFVLRNTNSVAGTLSFGAPVSLFLNPGEFAFRVSIRDLNYDGKPELIVSNSFDDPSSDNVISIFVNQSTSGVVKFAATPIRLTITGAGTTYGLDVQDLDGDQKPEIILNQFQTNDLFVLRNQSTGQISFATPQKISFTGFFNNVISGDVNGDGLLDLLLTSTFDNFLHVLPNQSMQGAIAFGAAQSFSTGNQPWGLDVSDVDGDQDLDVVVACKNAAMLNVFTNSGTGSFTRADIPTSKFTRNIKVGDFDGDAKPDFAFTALNSSNQYEVAFIRNANCVQPAIITPPGMILCAGQTKTLETTISLNTTIDWKLGAAVIQSSTSPTVSVNTIGNYTVTVTGESGACVATSPVYVVSNSAGVVPPSPSISSNGPVCLGGTMQLGAPTVANAVYTWTGPSMPVSQTSVQNPVIPNVTAQQAGLYTLVIKVGNCSSNVVSQTVDVATFPAFAITPSVNLPVCQGTAVTLSITAANNYTYQWLLNGSPLAGQTNTSVSVTQEGDYSLQATNSLLSCSTTTAATTVAILTTPVPDFSTPASTCIGSPVSFTDLSAADARATVVYAWSFGDTGTSALTQPSHTYGTAGSFNTTLTLSYAGSAACTASVTHPVSVVAAVKPSINPSATQSCPGEAVTLNLTGTFNSASWSNGVTGTSTVVSQPGTYKVTTIDAVGCTDSAQVNILSRPVPTLQVSADQNNVAPGVVVKLTVSGADTYVWSPAASLDNSTSATPSATPSVTTLYRVVGTLTGGCSAKDSIEVVVIPNGSLPAPLIFTPNGDGDNDLWKIPGIETYTDCTITVFDERGSKVFQKKGYANDWDGTNSGAQVPEGVYYYVFSCPNQPPVTGTVLIKRE